VISQEITELWDLNGGVTMEVIVRQIPKMLDKEILNDSKGVQCRKAAIL
jgi:hypothetical protein